MAKGYVIGWKKRETPEERNITDVGFDSHPEKAACWKTQEEAESACAMFDRWSTVVIPSAEGGTHVCKSFKVEKRAAGEFVVYCEAPFIITPKCDSTITDHCNLGLAPDQYHHPTRQGDGVF